MAQYVQSILDYLEYTDPKLCKRLKEEKRLLSTARALATEMAEEADRLYEQLRVSLPDEHALVQAEMIVLDEYLPTDTLQESGSKLLERGNL